MRRHQHRQPHLSSDSDSDDSDFDEDEDEDEDEEVSSAARRRRRRMKMKCLSCKEDYDGDRDAGTCRECYEEAGETEEELNREIEDLKSKVNFLRLLSVGPGPVGSNSIIRPNTQCFSDVVLVASGSSDSQPSSPSISAHRAVLTSRSPVFRAMLENEMEESISGTIKIRDVSYEALRAFVDYLYTAEACLDEHMACDLLVLAEKYQVKHLKTYCEKYLMSRLNWENSLPYYTFSNQHGAKGLLEAALSLIMDNMDKLSKQEEYMELVEKDPRVVVGIYEAYLSKQANTAAGKVTSAKTC